MSVAARRKSEGVNVTMVQENFLNDVAYARGRMLRGSRWKLNMVAKAIRGKRAGEALGILSGMRKRAAKDVSKVLLSAMANARHNQGLEEDRLRVIEATVGRELVLRRLDLRGRSRVGHIEKEFSQLRVVLVQEEA